MLRPWVAAPLWTSQSQLTRRDLGLLDGHGEERIELLLPLLLGLLLVLRSGGRVMIGRAVAPPRPDVVLALQPLCPRKQGLHARSPPATPLALRFTWPAAAAMRAALFALPCCADCLSWVTYCCTLSAPRSSANGVPQQRSLAGPLCGEPLGAAAGPAGARPPNPTAPRHSRLALVLVLEAERLVLDGLRAPKPKPRPLVDHPARPRARDGKHDEQLWQLPGTFCFAVCFDLSCLGAILPLLWAGEEGAELQQPLVSAVESSRRCCRLLCTQVLPLRTRRRRGFAPV